MFFSHIQYLLSWFLMIFNLLSGIPNLSYALDKYTFSLDGRPFVPEVYSLNGTPDKPAPGDVIYIDYIPIVLGPRGGYDFTSTPNHDGRVFLTSKDGKKRLIAVGVGKMWTGEGIAMINPLRDLTPEELRELRGIQLDGWPDDIEGVLKHLDLEKVCLTITDRTAQGKHKLMPHLPLGLWYLNIDESSSVGIKDYSALAEQKNLRFLRVRTLTMKTDETSFDAKWIEGNQSLRYLDLSGETVHGAEKIRSLSELRELRLSFCTNLKNISFVDTMMNLKILDVQGSGVSDLGPLGALTSIENVNANMAPIRQLPGGPLPNLNTLKIMSTGLSNREVSTFKTQHPGCQVLYTWNQALKSSLDGVTRIRIRTGGTCSLNDPRHQTVFEVKDGEQIAKIVDKIEIDEPNSIVHCMCCGEPALEFYRGDKRVVTLGIHHGQSLRWPGGWPGDGLMTSGCARFINKWLENHGYKKLKEMREKERLEEIREKERLLEM